MNSEEREREREENGKGGGCRKGKAEMAWRGKGVYVGSDEGKKERKAGIWWKGRRVEGREGGVSEKE